MFEFIHQLESGLQQPLPGLEAQARMAHSFRRSDPNIPENARIACVLILLYPVGQQWHIVLIKRVSHDRHDRHSGQISFPGGKYEEQDGSLLNGALREAQEEVGVPTQLVNPIGQLTQLYIPVSNFLVHPFIGYSKEQPQFVPQLSEVQSILEVPLIDLMKQSGPQFTNLKLPNNMVLQDVPCYNVEEHIVWGATAMMLSEFLTVVERNVGVL